MGGGTLQLSSGLNTFNSSGSFGQRSAGGGIGPGVNSFGSGQIGIGANGSNAFNNLTNVGTGSNIQQFLSSRGQFVGGASDNSFVGMSPLAGQNGLANVLAGLGQRNQNRNLNMNANQGVRTPPIHVSYTADIGYQAPSSTALATRLSTTIAKARTLQAIGPIKVEMDGNTAVLQGAVATAHDRSLAANLVMLEPGVSQVRNELAVEPNKTPASNLELPAPGGSELSR
jgi:hypothetical protein